MGAVAAVTAALAGAGGAAMQYKQQKEAKKEAKRQEREAREAAEEAERKRLAMTPTQGMSATQRIAAEKEMQRRRGAAGGRAGTVLNKSTTLG